MADLLQKTEELRALLALVLDRNQSLAAKPRQALDKAMEMAAQLSTHLNEISENYVDLKAVDDNQKALLKNVEYWNALPEGVLRGEALNELILKHSETLKSLYRAAIDIHALQKFSEEELRLAAEIGDNFAKYTDGCHAFKMALTVGGLQGGAYELKTRWELVESVESYLSLLVRRAIIKGYKFHVQMFEGNRPTTWREVSFSEARRSNRLHRSQPIRFEILDFDSRLRSFLTGHWFNAFAYVVFNDQLRRMELDYEIYTLVNFTSKTAGRVSKGDFDLIIKVENRLFLVECKSGRLAANEERDDYSEIIRKTETVKAAFESTRVSEYTFLLLCNPSAVNPKEAASRLAPSNIRVATPDGIRGFVIDLFRKS